MFLLSLKKKVGELVYIYYYLIAILIIGIDQWTKWLIVANMKLGESITVFENLLYITSHRNRGAAWGILEGQMWFFYIITAAVVIGLVYYMQKYVKNNVLMGISLSLMLGGAIGNFIDRVFRGEVVDFIHTYIFSYNFPIFNVADSSLCVGVGLLFIQMILDGKKEKEKA
ncbi:signal peptidase II [Metabacillus fastidiosus]|uniref:signal peptidase II n=1 Tax=Metabacillus fastidiosus TaxID=1458 RepID=UPI003D2C372E